MDAAQARRRLDEERARLTAVRGAASHISEMSEQQPQTELSQLDQHPADVASETYEREKDAAVLQQVDAALEEVDAALRRLDDGSYGVCERCGEPIGDERLEAMPAARLCVRDQARSERASA